MWVERVLAVVGLIRDSSLALSCPYHCGFSLLPSFLSGLACGLSIGLLAALVFFVIHSHSLHLHPEPPGTQPAPFTAVRRRSRLQGYLHE